MHSLKEIRKDFSKFEKDLEKRSVKIDFNNLKKLDELNRDLIQKKENLEKLKLDGQIIMRHMHQREMIGSLVQKKQV